MTSTTIPEHRYQNSSRAIRPGDAAYLAHDSGAFGYQMVPVIIVRVNRITVTVRNERGVHRLNVAAERNNVSLSWAGNEEDDAHERIRQAVA